MNRSCKKIKSLTRSIGKTTTSIEVLNWTERPAGDTHQRAGRATRYRRRILLLRVWSIRIAWQVSAGSPWKSKWHRDRTKLKRAGKNSQNNQVTTQAATQAANQVVDQTYLAPSMTIFSTQSKIWTATTRLKAWISKSERARNIFRSQFWKKKK